MKPGRNRKKPVKPLLHSSALYRAVLLPYSSAPPSSVRPRHNRDPRNSARPRHSRDLRNSGPAVSRQRATEITGVRSVT